MRYLQKIFVSILCLVTMGAVFGCTRYWTHADGSGHFDQDSALCQAVANGNAPMPTPQSPTGYAVSGSGYVNNTPFSYAGTIKQDPLAHSFNNFNASLGALATQNNIFTICMKRLGWREATENGEEFLTGERNKRYTACVEETAWRMVADYTTPQNLAADLEEICRKRTNGFVKNFAIYHAVKELEDRDKHVRK